MTTPEPTLRTGADTAVQTDTATARVHTSADCDPPHRMITLETVKVATLLAWRPGGTTVVAHPGSWTCPDCLRVWKMWPGDRRHAL